MSSTWRLVCGARPGSDRRRGRPRRQCSGGLVQADGDATFHPIEADSPSPWAWRMSSADRASTTRSGWCARSRAILVSATLVDVDGTVLASPVEVPANAEVTGATSRWLLLSAHDRTYVLGLDGVLRPAELPEDVTPTLQRHGGLRGMRRPAARCGPRVLDLAAATSRPLGEPDAFPYAGSRFVAEPGGERVAAARRGMLQRGGRRARRQQTAVPGAVRDPAWLPDGLGLLALSETGQLCTGPPDGQVRPLDLTVDDASHILVVTG